MVSEKTAARKQINFLGILAVESMFVCLFIVNSLEQFQESLWATGSESILFLSSDLEVWVQGGCRFLPRPLPSAAACKTHRVLEVGRLCVLQAPLC